MNDKIDELYDALKADGAVKKSRENFRSYVDDADNRQKLYEALKEDGAVKSPTFEEFSRKLGYNAAQGLPVNPATFAPMAPAAPSSGAVNVRAPFADAQATQQYAQQKPTSPTQPTNPTPAQNEQEQPLGPDRFAKQMAMDQQLGQRSQQLSQRLDAIRKENKPFGKQWNVIETREEIRANREKEGKGYLNELEDAYYERKRLEREIARRTREVDEAHMPSLAQRLAASEGGGMNPTMQARSEDAELSMLWAAKRSNEERIRVLERERDNPNFVQTVGKELLTPKTWGFGLFDMIDAATTMQYGDKKLSGTAAEAQEAMLRNMYDKNVAQQVYGENDTKWQKAGTASAQMVPFVLEFIATGGGMGFVRGATKLAAKQAAKIEAKNFAGKAAQFLVKNTGKAADDLARGFIMANTTGAAKTTSDIMGRHQGQLDIDENGDFVFKDGKSWGRSWKEGELKQTFEYASELFGTSFFDPLGKVVKGRIAKGVSKAGGRKVTDFMERMGSSKWANLLGQVGVNDLGSEVLEEEVNMALDAAFVGDTKWKDIIDPKVQGEMAFDLMLGIGGMRVPHVAMGGARTALYYRYKHATDKSDKVASLRMTAEKWEPLKDRIDGTLNNDMGALWADIMKSDDLHVEEKKAATEYIKNLMKLRGYNLATMNDVQRDEYNKKYGIGVNGEKTDGNEHTQDNKNETATAQAGRGESVRREGPRGAGNGLRGQSAGAAQGDSDGVNIGELAYGRGVEQHGDYEPGTRDEEEAVGHQIIENAKKQGVYIDPATLDKYGKKKDKPSGESTVYIDKENGRVVKVKDIYAKSPMKGHSAQDALYEHEVHNLLFPNSAYKLLGITEQNGSMRLVLEQPYVGDGFDVATPEQVEKYLTDVLGLKKEGSYWYGNEDYAITDVDGDNVLVDENGDLYFIDPIIKFKKPAKEVIEHLGGAVSGDMEAEAGYARGYDATDEQARMDIMIEHALHPDDRGLQAAVDGINDRINDDADDFVAQQREAYNLQRNDDDGSLHPATMNVGGQQRQVFVKSGLVTANPNGTIDIEHSGETIVVYDPVEGKSRMVSPSDLAELGEVVPQDQFEADLQNQRADLVQQQQDAATGRFNPKPGEEVAMPDGNRAFVMAVSGDNVTVQLPDGTQQDMSISDIQQIADGVMMNDYRQHHPETTAETATTDSRARLSEGHPDTYQPGMTLVLQRDGEEPQQVTVTGARARWNPTVGYVEDPNGRYVQVQMPDGSPAYIEADDPRGIITGYMPAPQEEPRREYHPDWIDQNNPPDDGGTPPPPPAAVGNLKKEEEPTKPTQPIQPINPRPIDDPNVPMPIREVTSGKGRNRKTEQMPDWYAATPARAHHYLYNELGLPREVADATVKANADDVAKAIADHLKKEPQPAANPLAYKAAHDSWNDELQALQDHQQYWSDVAAEQQKIVAAVQDEMSSLSEWQNQDIPQSLKEKLQTATGERKRLLRRAIKDVITNPGALAMLEDESPRTLEEVAASLLSTSTKSENGIKLMNADEQVGGRTIKGVASMTGYSGYDTRHFPGLFAKRANGGISVEEFGERVLGEASNLNIAYDELDAMAGSDAALSLLGQVGSTGDVANYILNNRIAEARKYYNDTINAEVNAFIEAHDGLTPQEYEAEKDAWMDKFQQVATLTEEDYTNKILPNYEHDIRRTAETSGQPEAERPQTVGDNGGGRTESIGEGQGQTADETAGGRNAYKGSESRRSGVDSKGESEPTATAPDNNTAAVAERITAAEAQTDTNPTEGQKKAGNYAKGHLTLDGYNISIEQPKGSIRRGVDADGRAWEQEMHNTYGYIRGTTGVDGDHIDIFLSDDPSQGSVFVIDQVNKDGSFDEHKVMYGFPDAESARQAYLSNYEDGWQGLGTITQVSKDEFKKWVESSHRKTKPFSEYKSVKPEGDVMVERQPSSAGAPADERSAEESREEREQRLQEERKQRILSEGTSFDKFFALTPVSETMTPEEIGANVRRIVEGLKANEGDNGDFEGFAYNGNYKKNAGHQVDEYLVSLSGVVPDETLRQWYESEGLKTRDDLRAYGEELYSQKSARRQKGVEGSGVGEVTKALRDGLVKLMRSAGLDVVTDKREGQQTLDKFRELVRLMSGSGKMKTTSDTRKLNSPEGEKAYVTVISDAESGAKVRKNLDTLAKKYEEKSSRLRNLLNDIAEALGAKQRGSGSKYVTIEAQNGNIVTIRLANHNASVRNFDNNGEPEGVSIVVAGTPNNGIENNGEAHVVEFFYRAQDLRSAEGKPLVKIIRSVEQMLYSGEYRDTTGLAQVQEVNAETLREMRAYHGSGADFDAFDHSHVGEGEGAQAYGWGTYVTEVEGIGKMYAEQSGSKAKNDAYTRYSAAKTATLRAVWDFQHAETKEKKEKSAAEYKRLQAEADKLYDEWLTSRETNVLYTVDIPDDNGSNYLEWNEPIKQKQLTKIASALAKEKGKEYGDYLKEKKGSYGENIYYELYTSLGSQQAASELLHSAGFVGIKYPAEYMSGGRSDGAKNYVVFDEGDLKITDKARLFRTEDGEVWGYTMDGKIYIDPSVATVETPIHEYTHLWTEALRKANPEAWERLKEEMRQQEGLMDYVRSKYPELTNEDELMDEVFAHYSGRRGAERLESDMREAITQEPDLTLKAQVALVFHKLRELLQKFWGMARDLFAGKVEGVEKLTADDFADMALGDLLRGFNPRGEGRQPKSAVEARDAEYMAAVERGDMETAQRMVDEAAREAMPDTKIVNENGTPSVVYHQTANVFTVFNPRHHGAGTNDNQMPFGVYLKPTDNNIGVQGERQMALFADIKNPLHFADRTALSSWLVENVPGYREEKAEYDRIDREYEKRFEALYSADGEKYDELWERWHNGEISEEEYQRAIDEVDSTQPLLDEWHEAENRQSAVMKNLVDDYMRASEYDGIVIDNDEGSFGRSTSTILALNPAQVKSADAVTYDDQGRVIPLSQRFDKRNADIRYQKAENTDGKTIPLDDLVAQRDYLLSDNYVSTLGGTEFEKGDEPLTKRVANYYKNNYDGKVDREGVGTVLLDERSVKDSIGHGLGRNKAVAFAAVPDIIRNGAIIDRQSNWKGRGYGSVTFAAPIEIAGEGYVGIVVANEVTMTDGTHRFYLHEVMLQKNLQSEEFKTGIDTGSKLGDVAKVLQKIVTAKNNSQDTENETSEQAKRDTVQRLADAFHTNINIVTDIDSIQDSNPEQLARKRRSPGWYSLRSREVTVVLPNNSDATDAASTVFHEVVGHKGMRELVGDDNYDTFLDEVYSHLTDELKEQVDHNTYTAFMDDILGRTSAEQAEGQSRRSYEQHRRIQTDEMIARMAETMPEDMTDKERSFWQRICDLVRRAIDRFLNDVGVKLPRWVRLGENEIRYMLWRSRQRLEQEGYVGMAKDIAKRHDLGLDDQVSFRDASDDSSLDDLAKDNSMGLKEKYTAWVSRLAAQNRDDDTMRRNALRAISDNLDDIRRAVSIQKQFDQSTVKRVADLARVLLSGGYLDNLTSGEVKRLLSAVKNSTGRSDITASTQKVMDIMVDNQLKRAEKLLHDLETVKAKKVNAKGVEVQGKLDVAGQMAFKTFKETRGYSVDELKEAMAVARDKFTDDNNSIADAAVNEYIGLQAALWYVENIKSSLKEERELKLELDDAVRAVDRNPEYEAELKDALRQNRVDRLQSYIDIIGRLSAFMQESVSNAKKFIEADMKRMRDIQHDANRDMQGRPASQHYKPTFADKVANNSITQVLMAPLATFDQMLRLFGSKSANGEGYLWNRYMRQLNDARAKESSGIWSKYRILDEKAKEVWGEGVESWADMIEKANNKKKDAIIQYKDDGEFKDFKLSQGSLMYIYMVDKMVDGRMKLRKMGIDEKKVSEVMRLLDPRLITIADWLQDEFLVETRNEYNETHKRLFGASMAAIENYFPLKIHKMDIQDKEEELDQHDFGEGITTKTGSIIKRTRNSLALDLMNADAMHIICDHIVQMEHWNAFAEFNRDLNTLRTYKRFRNQVFNMTSVYGGTTKDNNGLLKSVLWEKFNNVCRIATGSYNPKTDNVEKAAINIAKGFTAAKVSARMFTAFKQIESILAYIPEATVKDMARSVGHPKRAWDWCMENLPLAKERWQSRIAGDPRLVNTEKDWKAWRERHVQMAAKYGMTPNAFVDAVTVCIGAYAMYNTKYNQYIRDGYSKEAADKRARQDADILYNETQQSSEGAYLSPIQVDRTWWSVMLTVFRNSSMSYQRQLHDALRNIRRMVFEKGYKDASIEFMYKQIMNDGVEEEKAHEAAERRYNREAANSILRVAVFGFIVQYGWNLISKGGQYIWDLLTGDDDDKDKLMDDVLMSSAAAPLEGLTGGAQISRFAYLALSGEKKPYKYIEAISPSMPMEDDVAKLIKSLVGGRYGEAFVDLLNITGQAVVGVNPQTFTDIVVAIVDASNGDMGVAREAAICAMRILQFPQSQIDKMYFDDIELSGPEAKGMTFEQLAERYARYKVNRSTLGLGGEKEMENQRKYAYNAIKERVDALGGKELNNAYEDLETRYKDFEARKKELTSTTEYKDAHIIEKADLLTDFYDSDPQGTANAITFKALDGILDKIVKHYLDDSRTANEALVAHETILEYKKAMLEVLNAGNMDEREKAREKLEGIVEQFYRKFPGNREGMQDEGDKISDTKLPDTWFDADQYYDQADEQPPAPRQ